MKVDQAKLRENIRVAATLADSWLDKFHLWQAARPAPWTLVIDVAIVVAIGLVARML